MSLEQSWMVSLQKAVTKHFSEQDVGVPWDFDNSITDDRVSLTFLDPTAEKINDEETEVSFSVRAVCTITTEGLYDLASLSGKVAALLLEDIITDEACANSVSDKVKISLFDYAHGHNQSLMKQQYTSRLRG